MKLEDVVSNVAHLVADPVAVTHRLDRDDSGRILWVNNSFCSVFGLAQEDVLAMTSQDLLHWDYSEDFQARWVEMAANGEPGMSQDTLCLRGDKSSFWASVSLTAIEDEDANGAHAILVIRNIDELKNREQSAELALIENEHLLRKVEAAQSRLVSAIETIPGPFAIYDRRDRLVVWNPAFSEKMVGDASALKAGMKKEAILRTAIKNGFASSAVGREDDWIKDYMAKWKLGTVDPPVVEIHGRYYKRHVTNAPNGDRVTLGIDISEQLRQREELEKYAERLEFANNEISHQALHDELTGLGNRRYLTLKLEELIAARKVSGGELIALHIDLDRFKHINDTMGHAAGDHVLVVVADILRKHLRSDDLVVRAGGDEFFVILQSGPDQVDPEKLSDRLIKAICNPIPYQDKLCRLGASIGIAKTPMVPPEELLISSDFALYKAKDGGRAMHSTFDAADLESLHAAKAASDDIVRGIEEREFIPYYQVQVDAFENRVIALEVLARWNHPERGILPPSAFLDYAKDMQMMADIDAMVFRTALEECLDPFRHLLFPPTLSFNIGLQRISDDRLYADLDETDYPFPIAFELGETEFFDREHQLAMRIEMLRDRGVTIEVDDFGSGRASVVGLREHKADRLKLDHRLVVPIVDSISARKLVQSVIDVGRALEIPVTAEGIESHAHAKLLAKMGCDRLQGFHFAPAVPLDELLEQLHARETIFDEVRST